MRRILSATFVPLAVIGLSALALAQAKPQVTITHEMTNQDLNMAELQAFDQVASSKQRMAHRIGEETILRAGVLVEEAVKFGPFVEKALVAGQARIGGQPGNYLPDVTHASGASRDSGPSGQIDGGCACARGEPAARNLGDCAGGEDGCSAAGTRITARAARVAYKSVAVQFDRRGENRTPRRSLQNPPVREFERNRYGVLSYCIVGQSNLRQGLRCLQSATCRRTSAPCMRSTG